MIVCHSATRLSRSVFVRGFLLFLGYYFAGTPAIAQTDTTQPRVDTARVINAIQDTIQIKASKPHLPRRATMLAAVLPGSGQIYNKRYWKVPLVYIGFGIIGYFIYDNNRNYQNYLQAWTAKYNGGLNNGPYILDRFYPDRLAIGNYNNVEVLKKGKDLWRRYLELSVLSAAAFYALQIVDANVDAHLRGFNWNEDNLSLKLEPVIESNYAGVGLVLRW